MAADLLFDDQNKVSLKTCTPHPELFPYNWIINIFVLFRTMQAKLEVSAPILQGFNDLEAHFEWICNGSVENTVQVNLDTELCRMKMFLLSQGKETLTNIITFHSTNGSRSTT